MVLFIIVIVTLFLYLIVCLLYYFMQPKLLFKRKQFPVDFPFHYEFPFEELFWKTDDGNTLNGLWFKTPNPKGVILFLHGNSGHMGRSGNYFKRIQNLGYDVVMYDYRGYGKSTGTPTKQSLYSDSLEIFDWVKQQYPNTKIIVHGLSLGSHIASYVASHRALHLLILETPFLKIENAAKYRYPILPVKLLLRYPFNTAEFLSNITCPIHVFHGDCDKIVPLSEPQSFPKYNPNVTLTIIKDGNHKNLHDFPLYQSTLEMLLK